MAKAEGPPLSYPPDVRRPFGQEEALRRMAKVARFTSGARLLHLMCGGGAATVLFARELGCSVVGADVDEHGIELLRERIKTNNLADRVQAKVVDLHRLPFPEAEFEGIIADGGLPLGLSASAKALRKFLAPKGRLCIVYPVRVGMKEVPELTAFWKERLGEPIRLPREALQAVEREGFEPQTVETLPDVNLDEFYQSLEGQVASAGSQAQVLKDEIAVHRAQAGRSTVTFAMMIARRKEPGEKPPPSRSEG